MSVQESWGHIHANICIWYKWEVRSPFALRLVQAWQTLNGSVQSGLFTGYSVEWFRDLLCQKWRFPWVTGAGAGAVAGLIQPAFNAICCSCLTASANNEQRSCVGILTGTTIAWKTTNGQRKRTDERTDRLTFSLLKLSYPTVAVAKNLWSILTEIKWSRNEVGFQNRRTYGTSSTLKAILISESDGEANPYYFFNSIIIPGEWRGTQAFHFLEPTSWKSAMNLDTVAAARELNWENEAGSDLRRPAHLKYYGQSPATAVS